MFFILVFVGALFLVALANKNGRGPERVMLGALGCLFGLLGLSAPFSPSKEYAAWGMLFFGPIGLVLLLVAVFYDPAKKD